MSEPHTASRRPRFRRTDVTPSFQLTERDVEIVYQVARHKLLRSTHITLLVGASHKKICERLSVLFHAGYLDRPRAQLEYHARDGGSAPYVYALGSAGVRLLNERKATDENGPPWTRTDNDCTRLFLLHTLAVSDFRVSLTLACRARPDLKLLEPSELLKMAPEATQRQPDPWQWRVRVQFNEKTAEIGVRPDYMFALILPDGRRRPFVVECDRGTMPIQRIQLKQTSMFRKFCAYDATKTSGQLKQQFGWSDFRVLVVVNNDGRAQHMQRTIIENFECQRTPLFLFTSIRELSSTKFFTAWRDGERSRAIA